ncbi:MAG: rod shape-determining protein MreC [Acutalibacteraceae bacterium]|nr:rod shape-determining protein MreC [Acutalibacteraceae bacterium]
MIRFLKSSAFKMFAIIAAALVAGSVFAVASRSGSSPLTSVISVVFGPLSRLSSYVAAEFSDIPISFKSSSVLLKENEELQKKIDSLTDQLVDYEQLRHKNEFYQQFLEIKEEHSDYTFAEAAIIGRDAADNMGSFTLNKGSAHDIKVNDPVIYGKYLVGVVASVTPTQCTVNTILNPKVNVSAYEVRTRDLGYVTSTVALAQEGHCHMPGLASSTAVTAGGIVCTSGVGGIFPRDLIIGNIVDVVDGTVDISASAIIEPGMDFAEITDVFIITSFDGQNQ